MKSMADHNNNISRRDNNINCSNSPNHSRYRGSVSSDAKNIIKSSATEPSSSSGFTVNAAGSANRAERCVLCLDEKRSPVRITCGHSFCNECLDVYKSYQKYAWATRCPICRGSLKEKRRSVKRKRSEDNNAITTTTTRIRTSTGRNGGTSHMRMSAVATPVETATETTAAADADGVTTVPSETTADVPAEQIYLLEEFMAIASETDVFGLSSDMTFANAGSVSTPTNSVSTVSASEAEQEDMEVEEIEGTVGVDARFAETDFASDLEGEEIEDEVGLEGYEEEVFNEDLDEEEEWQMEDEADEEEQNDDIDDETDDVYYFNEFDNEHYDDPGNNDYDTVDEEDFGDDDNDDESNEQSQNDDYCAEEQESESEVVVVDEVIIID